MDINGAAIFCGMQRPIARLGIRGATKGWLARVAGK